MSAEGCPRREGVPWRDFVYPRWTRAPGAGGRWVSAPETFRVEEIPLYPFCGEGEHAAVVVEKAERTTRDLALAVAQSLGLSPSAVGYAGMKDKRCVAVQAFTIGGVAEAAAARAFEDQGCRVHHATRHRNKLRLGHLAGNRFRAFVAGAGAAEAEQVLEELGRDGAPNYFGRQRFGARGDNAAQGLAVLRGRLRVSRWKRDLLVSALQSLLFNEVLARRIEDRALAEAREGDVLRREDSGGLFLCADPEADTARVKQFGVSPTGPMWGRKMVRPAGEVERTEQQAGAGLGLSEDLFGRETGTRRPLRVPVTERAVEPGPNGIWVSFVCPAGAFASVVIREIQGEAGSSDGGD